MSLLGSLSSLLAPASHCLDAPCCLHLCSLLITTVISPLLSPSHHFSAPAVSTVPNATAAIVLAAVTVVAVVALVSSASCSLNCSWHALAVPVEPSSQFRGVLVAPQPAVQVLAVPVVAVAAPAAAVTAAAAVASVSNSPRHYCILDIAASPRHLHPVHCICLSCLCWCYGSFCGPCTCPDCCSCWCHLCCLLHCVLPRRRSSSVSPHSSSAPLLDLLCLAVAAVLTAASVTPATPATASRAETCDTSRPTTSRLVSRAQGGMS